MAALILAQLAIATFVAITMMGWWFPGRMLIVVFPLFPLVLGVAWIRASRVVRCVGVAAAGYSLLVTGLLAKAAHDEAVRIAVDPFGLTAAPLRLAGPLFPDYRLWDSETYALTAAWLALGATALAGSVRRRFPNRFAAAVRVIEAFAHPGRANSLPEVSHEP